MYTLTIFLEKKYEKLLTVGKSSRYLGVLIEGISFYSPSFHTILMFNQVLLLMTVKSIKGEWFVIAENYSLK